MTSVYLPERAGRGQDVATSCHARVVTNLASEGLFGSWGFRGVESFRPGASMMGCSVGTVAEEFGWFRRILEKFVRGKYCFG